MLKDLSELRLDDPVVHEQHGVGRYKGLVDIDFGEGETELLLIEYHGEDKLYVLSRNCSSFHVTQAAHQKARHFIDWVVGSGKKPRKKRSNKFAIQRRSC